MKRARGRSAVADEEAELSGRKPFTQGWVQELNSVELLPIKANGKVIRKKVERKNVNEEDELVEEQPEQDRNTPSGRKDAVSDGGDDDGSDADEKPLNDSDFNQTATLTSLIEKYSLNDIKQKVATICFAITTDPERSLSRVRQLQAQQIQQGQERDTHPRLSELLALLNDPSYKVKELVMLSTALVFRDICPGYRIRPPDKSEKEVQLKKETKKLRDFEKSLLASYDYFLKYLNKVVFQYLGKPSASTLEMNTGARFGLSALRCQCEMLRTMLHFNFHNVLVTSIVSRGSQPIKVISDLCCSTINNILENDTSGEISYEIVKEMSSNLQNMKHLPFDTFVDCLTHVKLRVHANESKNLSKKAKQQRRKRRRGGEAGDDVDADLMESAASADNLTVKKFQADSLQEVALIYFRYEYYFLKIKLLK
jgi:hypothetical protein